MPYIKQEDRKYLDPPEFTPARTPGELNYQFTIASNQYISSKGLSYQVINDIIGALEGAKMEFYRCYVAPYEDAKIQENGDVY